MTTEAPSTLQKPGHNVGTARPLNLTGDVTSTALYGPAGGGVSTNQGDCYRYTLKRVWDPKKPLLMWLMMNPSVATEDGDDRTVAKCQRYARQWGYGGILVGNSCAYRCTDQKRLLETPDPVGPENHHHLLEMAKQADKVILAYGTPKAPELHSHGPQAAAMLARNGVALHALEVSKNGRPKHPLYLSSKLTPKPYQLP
ncbi:DUF1643 domain-containing protein [Formicincola oecophyllae]|uniref:DUF1643 domain-containing protein n=1 Tax=Formicincola oecophyllae TaxID=2558361 RepID=A0A4Y6UAW0_9PROT|nr:DUF1643 domain-containing protein [Formicincola oecophyllae]QDH13596.1 DUF1643 domain-containing protein [Formicincola oecophyllae]